MKKYSLSTQSFHDVHTLLTEVAKLTGWLCCWEDWLSFLCIKKPTSICSWYSPCFCLCTQITKKLASMKDRELDFLKLTNLLIGGGAGWSTLLLNLATKTSALAVTLTLPVSPGLACLSFEIAGFLSSWSLLAISSMGSLLYLVNSTGWSWRHILQKFYFYSSEV